MVASTTAAPGRSSVAIFYVDERGIVRQTDPSQHYSADQLRRKLDEVKAIVWPKWLEENGGDPTRLHGLRYEFAELGIFIDGNDGCWRRLDPMYRHRKLRNSDEAEYLPRLNVADLAFGRTRSDIYRRLLQSAHLWGPCIGEEAIDNLTVVQFGGQVRLVPSVDEEADVALVG